MGTPQSNTAAWSRTRGIPFSRRKEKPKQLNERRTDMAEIGHGGKEIVERIMAPAEAAQR